MATAARPTSKAARDEYPPSRRPLFRLTVGMAAGGGNLLRLPCASASVSRFSSFVYVVRFLPTAFGAEAVGGDLRLPEGAVRARAAAELLPDPFGEALSVFFLGSFPSNLAACQQTRSQSSTRGIGEYEESVTEKTHIVSCLSGELAPGTINVNSFVLHFVRSVPLRHPIAAEAS